MAHEAFELCLFNVEAEFVDVLDELVGLEAEGPLEAGHHEAVGGAPADEVVLYHFLVLLLAGDDALDLAVLAHIRIPHNHYKIGTSYQRILLTSSAWFSILGVK